MGKEKYKLSIVVVNLLLFSILLSIIITPIGYLIINLFQENYFTSVPKNILLSMLLLIPIMMIYTNMIAVFQGLQDFRALGYLTLVPVVISLILCVTFLELFDNKLIGALLYWSLGYFISTIMILSRLGLELHRGFSNYKFRIDICSDMLIFGLKTYTGNLVSFMNYRVNYYLITAFIGVEALGIYTATIPITEGLWLLANASSSVIFPLVANRSVGFTNNSNITPLVSRIVFLITLLSGVFLAAIAKPIINTFFGASYADATILIYILLPGVILFSVTKVLSNDIAGRGHPEINLYITSFVLIFNVLLTLLLMPLYGIFGAAAAVSLSYILYTIIVLIIYSRLCNMRISSCFLINRDDILLLKNSIKKLPKATLSAKDIDKNMQ